MIVTMANSQVTAQVNLLTNNVGILIEFNATLPAILRLRCASIQDMFTEYVTAWIDGTQLVR